MNHVAVVPEALRAYAGASATMAAGVAQAGAVDQAATTAAVVPVFGLIGQEFLLSFVYAQANHLTSVAQLAAVHAGTAVTAAEGAATYEGADAAAKLGIGSIK
ncbi:type VII secretion target [Nocardia camponoti]|uniref:ESX-1 secretion-associated protein n=1 Tax=Nocardia camponoti TaxID=1616106 RepID=A0A917QN17_9NOCA|nr:type VII secretion target [Nocardia camponoti]GGK57529.1 hypothetical protein GCM10011591_32100 [Nocardia camponoti]